MLAVHLIDRGGGNAIICSLGNFTCIYFTNIMIIQMIFVYNFIPDVNKETSPKI